MNTLTLEPTASIPNCVYVETDSAWTRIPSLQPVRLHRIRMYIVSDASTPPVVVYGEGSPLLVADLGWTRQKAAAVRAQLAAFEQGWDSPEMDAYDAL